MSSLDLQLPSPLPGWLPDETLFSLASRFHVLSGNRLPAETCQALFGSAQRGYEHDLPTRLAELSQRTRGVLGNAADIAVTRTLLPFYLPLKSLAVAEAAIRSLVDVPDGMLKFQLGMLTSRFRANHPLKACAECVAADRATHGTPYWHRMHQYPGVWHCATHGVLLHQSSVKSTGVRRFGWTLPHEATLTADETILNAYTAPALARFAELVGQWARLPVGIGLDTERLARVYRAAAIERLGSLALHPRSRGELHASFREAVAPLRVVSELHALPASDAEAGAQLRPRMLTPRDGTHPLRHLAIIYWLFGDWPHFWHSYEASGTPTDRDRAFPPSDPKLADPREGKFLVAVRDGQSVSSASRRAGITVTTGLAWATRHGITVRLRPKSIGAEIRRALISGLRKGVDKRHLAERCEVSIQTVTRVLQTEIGLRAVWRAAQQEQRRSEARSGWAAALKKFKGLPLTLVRREASAAYAWLYRNDRGWLDEHRGGIVGPTASNYSRVDWDSRDSALSADVRRIAAEVATRSDVARVELWQIYQRLPELKAKLGALERLPLTLKAIQETTGRRRKDSAQLSL
jgi:hypothetical protein